MVFPIVVFRVSLHVLSVSVLPPTVSVLVIFVPARGKGVQSLPSLEEESDDLPPRMFPACLLVRHDAVRRRHDDLPELACRQQVRDPLLHVGEGHVEAGGDDPALVQTAGQLDDDLAGAVVVD